MSIGRPFNQIFGADLEHLRYKLTLLHLRALQSLHREHPIPLGYWLKFGAIVKTIFRSRDALLPLYGSLQSTGESLQVPELRQLLRNDILGLWSLDGTTINFLWKKLQHDRPKVILECGAGVSSLILAKYAASHGSGRSDAPTIFSLEQDMQIKKAIESRLAECGLGGHVQILHVPLSESASYEIDANELLKQLGSRKVDWLLIDGPAGPKGCRKWTLPLLAGFCRSDARWFLDDAFREGELGILREWRHSPGIVVEGIYPIGKGLGTGLVKDSQRVNSQEWSNR
jgi:hypothetical protein